MHSQHATLSGPGQLIGRAFHKHNGGPKRLMGNPTLYPVTCEDSHTWQPYFTRGNDSGCPEA